MNLIRMVGDTEHGGKVETPLENDACQRSWLPAKVIAVPARGISTCHQTR